MELLYIAPVAGAVALLFALYLWTSMLSYSPGNEKMQEISNAIFEGAMAFLNRQYKTLIPFVIVIFVILFYVDGWKLAVSFLVGAICSAIAGYVGMSSTTKANARTTEAARTGLNEALGVSFKAGAVMGMAVAGLALLGVSVLYIVFKDPVVINSFAFGASAIAFFARVGGGIFTKAADVGADLVGKVEAGIPEDDPRNPAVIADNVGDNVGDTAGMGADLFESYGATTIAAMIIGNALYGIEGVLFPLLVGAAGIAASIISTFFVRTTEDGDPQQALNIGIWSTNVITGVMAYFLANHLFGAKGFGIFVAIISGLLVNVLIGIITEYYTSHAKKPTQIIAAASETGAATNLIAGLATGLQSTLLPILVIVSATWISFQQAGTYGIAMAAMGMLCTSAMVVAVDSFGPVADNAGGIAEMADLGPEVRLITDKLDAVGNTTAAIAKGFAIGSAALTALALFAAFAEEVSKNPKLIQALANGHLVANIMEPNVMIGIFLGAVVPFIVCGLTMEAVGKAAFSMIEEVRRQFREIPGIMEGTGKPDYASCVDISTRAAIREMIQPGLWAVLAPVTVGFVLGTQALAGFLAGITATGVLMAIFMANAGGAWDNAKKYIETGKHGGKGTPAHAAAVIGDTVGDPFKDTSGPAMNPLIKVAGTVSLLIAPYLFF
ncbi:MAG: sodium-translocating pyrophosphatase [Negativicutes bacterium]|jgi:K(+)-stimulated pyrophosphate-energized sodium pump|nr:sodium-translocating pyrophosphatase [Negativicutes bacterium]